MDKSGNNQAIIAGFIVCALLIIALAAIWAALQDHSVGAVAFGAVGVVVGSLATALNAPNGLTGMLKGAGSTTVTGPTVNLPPTDGGTNV